MWRQEAEAKRVLSLFHSIVTYDSGIEYSGYRLSVLCQSSVFAFVRPSWSCSCSCGRNVDFPPSLAIGSHKITFANTTVRSDAWYFVTNLRVPFNFPLACGEDKGFETGVHFAAPQVMCATFSIALLLAALRLPSATPTYIFNGSAFQGFMGRYRLEGHKYEFAAITPLLDVQTRAGVCKMAQYFLAVREHVLALAPKVEEAFAEVGQGRPWNTPKAPKAPQQRRSKLQCSKCRDALKQVGYRCPSHGVFHPLCTRKKSKKPVCPECSSQLQKTTEVDDASDVKQDLAAVLEDEDEDD